jgi:osmoprotectant transport system permease protein
MMGARARRVVLVVALAMAARHAAAHAQPAIDATPASRSPITIASKPFAESYLLAEMMAQLLEAHGHLVVRRPGLGATEVAFGAVRTGAVDAYPEYVGTGLLVVLRDSVTPAMRRDPRLAFREVATASEARFGVRWLPPLGFRNGYALAVRRGTADSLQLRTMSDVSARGAALRAGFTSDFIGRADGWPGVRAAYGWTLASVRPLAPALKYDALRQGAVDLVDGYDTDAPLADTTLVVLPDDRGFFPPYEASIVVSAALRTRDPAAVAVLTTLSGRMTEAEMRRWNAALETDRRPVRDVAHDALRTLGLVTERGDVARADAPAPGLWAFLWARRAETARLTGEHLLLVAVAMLLALAVALPAGVWLADRATAADRVLQGLALAQTIPGLALLALLLPVLGVGAAPALVALWVYALLPVVQGTVVGLRAVDATATEALAAMGATPRQQLWWARVPLAAPVLVTGVRTATVITIGTATLAAFVGGGGLGEPIVTGLGLADERLVLSGAIPAALLALVVDRGFAWLTRRVTPAHQRVQRG